MKKKLLSVIISAALAAASVCACSAGGEQESASSESSETEVSSEASDESSEESSDETQEESESETEAVPVDDVTVRVGSLSGPTTIGILNLMNDFEEGNAINNYEFTMLTQPDEIAAQLGSGDLDIALIPANLASILYNRTEGAISVIDINTLGVLYCITADGSITSVSDLAGKTVVTTGEGATPEYALRYLLAQYGVEDCELDFRSEGTEVVSVLAQDPDTIVVLPQPAATAAIAQAEGASIAFSLTDEWAAVTDDSILVTGVTVVRNEFLEEHPDAVNTFIAEQSASVEAVASDLEGTAQLAVDQGIIGAVPVATTAIPLCNTVCITGDEMKDLLEGYLNTLNDQNPQAVGGALPEDDFYYIG